MTNMYKKLYIWVEGDRDRRFFQNIIEPLFKNRFDKIAVTPYRNMKKQDVNSIIKKTKGENDYIFTKDMDYPTCMGRKKESIVEAYSNINRNKIVIVEMDIEGWYLAGLSKESCEELEIKYDVTTNRMTKSEFNSIRPKKFTSDIDFRMEILKKYDLNVAKSKNQSIRYFLNKYKEILPEFPMS